MRCSSWLARSNWVDTERATETNAAALPSVHSSVRPASSSGGSDIVRSAKITPISRPAAVIGAHTSRAGSETTSANSSLTSPARSPTTSTTLSVASARPAIGADSTVTCAEANGSMLIPCAPAARTRRLALS